MNIVIAGVGYVGLVTGLGFAKLGHNIQFLDTDSNKIKKLKDGEPPFFEPNLETYLNNDEIIKRCNFSDDYSKIIWETTDIFMVCVQTPSSEDGELDIQFIESVFASAIQYLNTKTVICIKSTIHPIGIGKVLNNTTIDSEKIVFNPEFLREGLAFYDFFNPDRIVIGSTNKDSSNIIGSIYKDIDSEILYTDPISSQLIKYLSNAYLPMRLSFANEASRLIASLDGDLNSVMKGIGLDKRIGNDYFRPSPGWGGSCFPKDVKEIINIADSKSLNLPLMGNILESNDIHMSWFAEKLINLKEINQLDSIILIGAAFKEDTDDLRDSPTLCIYKKLNDLNVKTFIYDEEVPLSSVYNTVVNFSENILIVEMYPLNEKKQLRLMEKIKSIENYIYYRHWEKTSDI